MYPRRPRRVSDGAYYGGASFASTVSMFSYFLSNGGRSQHPDAMFRPEDELTLKPGALYEPKGRIWMLALCGSDGVEGWKRATAALEAKRVARSIYAMTGSSRPYAASNATCLRSFTRQLCSSSSRPDL